MPEYRPPAGSGGGDVVTDTSPQLGGNLDTNDRFIQFDDAKGISDSNENEQLIFKATASAVNHLKATNAATGNNPQIAADGDDTNVGLTIASKGTGDILLEADAVGIGETSPDADLHVTSASSGEIFILETTDNGAASGPDITMVRDSSSPASGDFLGRLLFKGRDAGGNLTEYGNIKAQLGDPTNGAEDFNMFFQGVVSGSNRSFLGLRGYGGIAGNDQAEVCVNENSIDMDFRVESDADTATFFVEGSTARVGISTTSPVATLDVDSGKTFRATRLLTVSLSANTTLSESSHAGRYIFVTGTSRVITLPDNQAAGVHFTLLSNDGNGFTLRTGTGSSDGDNMNGAQTDITVDARNGVTCISTGTDYVVLGA